MFGHETVDLLYAALRVLAVAAHVPLANRAVRAGDGIGTADDAHHQIALVKPACWARVYHPAERFVTQHEARLAGWSPAVMPLHNLHIGPADPHGDGLHEH